MEIVQKVWFQKYPCSCGQGPVGWHAIISRWFLSQVEAQKRPDEFGGTFHLRFQLPSERWWKKKRTQLLSAGWQKWHLCSWQMHSSHAEQEVFRRMWSEFLSQESLTSQRQDVPLLHAAITAAGKSSQCFPAWHCCTALKTISQPPPPASLKENPKTSSSIESFRVQKPTCCQYLFTLALLPLSLSQWAPPAFIFSLRSRRPRKPAAPLLAGAVSAKGIAVFPTSKPSPRGLCGPFSPLKRSPQQDDPIAASWRLRRNRHLSPRLLLKTNGGKSVQGRDGTTVIWLLVWCLLKKNETRNGSEILQDRILTNLL